MTIYWLAMAQLLYRRCAPGILPWDRLTRESKEYWVRLVQESGKLLSREPGMFRRK